MEPEEAHSRQVNPYSAASVREQLRVLGMRGLGAVVEREVGRGSERCREGLNLRV